MPSVAPGGSLGSWAAQPHTGGLGRARHGGGGVQHPAFTTQDLLNLGACTSNSLWLHELPPPHR